jgi:hypothetical protein
LLKGAAGNGEITLYPIPAKQQITLHCTNDQFLGQKIHIVDNTGKVVQSYILQKEGSIDISAFAVGVYLIQLPDGTALKMIKQ